MTEHDVDPEVELEERLRRDLGRLAERAQASPDALDRILTRPPRRPRRSGVVAAGLVAVAAAMVAAALPHALGRQPETVRVNGTAAAAERPAGRAAYVSDGRLYLLHPGSEDALSVAVPGPVSRPTWSRHGHWIAYRQLATKEHPESVHIMRADGSGEHTVYVGSVNAYSWSPADDLLAIAPGWSGGGGLLIATPTGGTRDVLPSARVVSYTWARSGLELAASLEGQLLRVDLHGVHRLILKPPAGQRVLLGGWWPGDRGLLYWLVPAGDENRRADGVTLWSVATPGDRAMPLVTTLNYHRWVAWSPDGLQLLTVAGGGREPWANKHLALCRPAAGTCVDLPQPAGTVSLDPAWSPDGRQIAFVRAAAAGTPEAGRTFAHWFGSRQLWIADADGSRAQPVAGATSGAVQPSWNDDGTTLRYSTAADIRQIELGGGDQRLTGPLSGGQGDAGPDAYGKGQWLGIALWAP